MTKLRPTVSHCVRAALIPVPPSAGQVALENAETGVLEPRRVGFSKDPERAGRAKEQLRTFKAGLWLLFSTSSLVLCGCGRGASSKAIGADSKDPVSEMTLAHDTNAAFPGMQANPLESTNILRSFMTRGVIRQLSGDGQTVVVRHEDIPGFMPKMTMEFNVGDTNELRGLRVGDAITFNVKANEKESWIEGIRLTGTNGMGSPATSDAPSSTLLHVAKLKPGDLLPDAEILMEDGRTLRFSDFKGRALAFTFLFTRCPLPDFCPRMNQHFSRARELLTQLSGGPTNWQFLSISFDPEFDRPAVLASYAYSYRGQNTDRWLFGIAPGSVLSSLSSELDFRFANEGGSFVHNLRTVVVDPERRIYKQFDGNKWKAEELAQALAEAAQLGQKRPSS